MSRFIGRAATVLMLTLASLAFGVGSASAASVAASSTPDITLQVSLADRFTGCDPVGSVISPAALQALSLVLPGAFVSSGSGTVVQADSFLEQAEVQSLKPLVVAYTLNPAARWVDGRPIGIADFLATWRIGARGTGPAAAQYRLIRSIKIGPSSNQVLVQFSLATSDWRALFSPLLPATAPRSAMLSCSSPDSAVDLSGGPYVIASSSPSSIILIRNPRWWGAQPQLSSITLNGASEPSAVEFSGLDNVGLGESNWLPPQVLAGMTSSPGVSSNVDFSNRILSLDFNTTKHGSVQILLRRAISSYLDRRAIVQTTVGAINPSIAPGGSHLLAQGQPGYVGPAANGPLSAAKVSANAAEVAGAHARAALQIERAGYHRNGSIWVSATGVPLAMEMLVPLDDHWAGEVGAIVKDQLSASGITVKVVGVSNSTVVAQTLRTSRAQLGIIVRPSDPFPAHGASWFTRSPTGPTSGLWAGYQSRALNLLAAQASQDLNPADAQPLYQAIDAKLWTAMPSLPIFTEPAILEWSTVIDGVMLNPFPPGTLSGLLSWKIVNPSP